MKKLSIITMIILLSASLAYGAPPSPPSTGQPADAELTAIAGLTSAANAIPYFTGSGTAGVISSSADVVALLGAATTKDFFANILGEVITNGHLFKYNSTTGLFEDAGAPIEATDGLTFHFDGGGAEIADNKIACTTAKFAMDITAWTIIPDQSGSIKIDIWKDTYANGLPTNDDTITNGHEPEVSSAAKAQDTDLSDWTTLAVAAGDIVCASVDSATTITWANLVLTGMRK